MCMNCGSYGSLRTGERGDVCGKVGHESGVCLVVEGTIWGRGVIA